jgi:hypothetical protein
MRTLSFLVVAAVCQIILAQESPSERHYIPNALMTQANGNTMIVANDPRPLKQVVDALVEKYGWTVDFEDPPYRAKFDLQDATSPTWRSAHPRERGINTVAGGRFVSTYSEAGPGSSRIFDKQSVLNKVVADYHTSANPGQFSVYDEGAGRFALVGQMVKNDDGRMESTSPILDTRINLPQQERTLQQTIELVLGNVSFKSKQPIILSSGPAKVMFEARVTVGGEDRRARDLLRQAFDQTGLGLRWTCLYEPTFRKYHFNGIIVPGSSR